MRLVGWLCVGLGLVACGRTQRPDPDAAGALGGAGGAGARLVPWQLEADGTEPLVLGAYDTELGQHCRFAYDAEGTLRCLPPVPGLLRATFDYADSGCERPLYASERATASAVRVAGGRAVSLPPPLDSCAEQYAVGILQEVAESAPRYFKTEAGCAMTAGLPPDLQQAEVEFAVDEVIEPARFVSGTPVDGALLAGRLRVREVETEQGFRAQLQLVDQRWQKACSLKPFGEDVECVPATIDDYPSFFVDQECVAQPLWRAPACVEPAFIAATDGRYALGEQWTGPIFQLAKVCESWRPAAASGDRFFAQGAALDESAVAKAAWLRTGDERLGLRALRGDDGQPVTLADELFDSSSLRRATGELHSSRYHDALLEQDCSPVFTTDGEVRCVPETALIDPYALGYADEECSEPAYLCQKPDGCEGADMIAMAYDENGEYRAVSRNATEPLGNRPLFMLQGGGCEQLQAPDGMFSKASERPWDDYPLLREVNPRRSGEP
jgi:hypothetical protein